MALKAAFADYIQFAITCLPAATGAATGEVTAMPRAAVGMYEGERNVAGERDGRGVLCALACQRQHLRWRVQGEQEGHRLITCTCRRA